MTPSEWAALRLGAVCTKIGSGATPRGGSDVYLDSGPYALIRSQNIYNDGFHRDGLAYIGEEHAAELGNVEVRQDDVLLTITGDSVARCCQVDASVLPARVNQHVTIIRPAPEKLMSRFLRYVLISPEMQTKLLSWAGSGGTRNALTKRMIESVEVLAPIDVKEQRAIADILGTLDDKIALNRRISETLEAMARAIFQSWFVDFDPVRARSEARDSHLPRSIADLFPDCFEESELGRVPAGWPVMNLGDCCRRVAMGPFGSDIRTDNFVAAGVPVIRGSNLTHGFVDEGFVFLSDQKADSLRNANAFPGDIVITHRGTLGQVGLIPKRSRFARYVVSQSQLLLAVDSTKATVRYVFEYLRSPVGQHALLANTSQTGVPAIARPTASVRAIRLVVPPGEVLATFDRFMQAAVDREVQATQESAGLAGLRDTLLPKLVSGKVRVKDAELFPARAV